MEYKFSGQISYDDFMQFQQFNLKNSLNKILPVKRLPFVLLFLIIIIIADFRRDYSLQKVIIWIIIMAIIAGISLIFYHSKRLYKKLFENDQSNKEKCDYIINENSIIIKYRDTVLSFDKNNIHKILFDDDSIYIFQEPNIAKIIKKSFFDDENIYASLLSFIKEEYGA
jgi:hypothetical protein